MTDKPAVLVSDEQVSQLTKTAISKISFQELTGSSNPWEIDIRHFQTIRSKLTHIEETLRSTHPVLDITCVIAGEGVYWQSREGLDVFLKGMESAKKKIDQSGPYPIWKLTSAELFASHLCNMRQLIMGIAHLLGLFDSLKKSFGSRRDSLLQEFDTHISRMQSMIDEYSGLKYELEFALAKDIILMERVWITQEMLNQGLVTEQQLGYSTERLMQAQGVLERRCEKDFPQYPERLQNTFNSLKDSLRDGECAHLHRASQWEYSMAVLGIPPIGYQGYAKLCKTEREILTSVVASREAEIGESELGKTVLLFAEEVRSRTDQGVPLPTLSNESMNEIPRDDTVRTRPIKKPPQMAIIDRIER